MTIHQQPTSFRADVEGLRAIAVLMVLVYHLDGHWLGGGFSGVDVFFVISGFLITNLLAREIDKTGTINLVNFYARRAKRLFPAAALVLASTAAASWWLMPSTRWQAIGGDITAAAGYFINWRLAERSVDYLAEDIAPSPVQHFWSLAVEEQYYIVWPLLLVALLWALGRWIKGRPLLLAVTVLVGVPSFVYSIIHTTTSPATAYFITTTRMWELAIGATIALTAVHWTRIPAGIAATLGWLGVACIVISSTLISRDTAWPGYAALAPTLGAAAVIAGGFAAGRKGPLAILGTSPMVWIGGLSYSLYLWHWPLVQLAKAHWGNEISAPVILGIAASSIALAWLTLHWVENPIRESKRMHDNPRYALSTGLNFTLIGIVAGLCLILASLWHTSTSAPQRAEPTAKPAGAMALSGLDNPDDVALQPSDTSPVITPLPEAATRDVPQAYEDGCQLGFGESTPKPCYYGNPDAKTTVAVIGDSKVVQWLPALQRIAQAHDWRILVHAKSSCGFHDRPLLQRGNAPYVECTEWNHLVRPLILGTQKPDIAIVSMGGGSAAENDAEISALRSSWQSLTDAGIRVVAIANNPGPPSNVYECVARNPDKLTECAFPRKNAPATASMRAAASSMEAVSFIDMNNAICNRTTCSAVIGGVLVYRQGSHLTRTYIDSLAPALEHHLVEAGIIDRAALAEGSPSAPPVQPTGNALPLNIQIPFPHTIDLDRDNVVRDGKRYRQVRLKYSGKTAIEAFQALSAELTKAGLRQGRIKDTPVGELRSIFSNGKKTERVLLQVTPASASKDETDGTAYFSQLLKD